MRILEDEELIKLLNGRDLEDFINSTLEFHTYDEFDLDNYGILNGNIPNLVKNEVTFNVYQIK